MNDKLRLTNSALNKIINQLGADGQLELCIEREPKDMLSISLIFEDEAIMSMNPVYIPEGSSVTFAGMKFSVDLEARELRG